MTVIPSTHLAGTQALAMAFLDPSAARLLAASRAPSKRTAGVAVKHTATRSQSPGRMLQGKASMMSAMTAPLGSATNTHLFASGIGHSMTSVQNCAACNAAKQAAASASATCIMCSQQTLQQPASALVSHGTVVTDAGLRVSKTLGVALREWGHLYPQAFQGQATFSEGRLSQAQYSGLHAPGQASLGAWMATSLNGFPVVERQDTADFRR